MPTHNSIGIMQEASLVTCSSSLQTLLQVYIRNPSYYFESELCKLLIDKGSVVLPTFFSTVIVASFVT
jgi:hypothetical protein